MANLVVLKKLGLFASIGLLGISILDFMIGSGFAAQTAAETPPANTSAAPSHQLTFSQSEWIVSCSTPKDATAAVCEMNKQLFTGQQRQLLGQVTIFLDDKDRTYQMRVLVPHGLDLTQGLAIAVDAGAPIAAPFTTSTSAGVIARLTITKAIFDGMNTGKVLSVTAKSRNAKQFIMPFNLTGFPTSIQKLQ